jgi:hypothetical protein
MRRKATAPRKATKAKVKAGLSWIALLAATSLGIESADMIRAVVQSEEPLPASRTFRLVVQSYDAADGELPGAGARPVASVQRAVTGEELRAGVPVSLVELRDVERAAKGEPVIVAWVEDGAADLELDGLRARPQRGAVVGVAPRTDGDVRIALKRAPASAG